MATFNPRRLAADLVKATAGDKCKSSPHQHCFFMSYKRLPYFPAQPPMTASGNDKQPGSFR
ncbi:MAG: hypothetical protein RMK99_16305, partial [Anaerolineales bacterium]|nr:hypothetical protein [Anaerolineales bacterium]